MPIICAVARSSLSWPSRFSSQNTLFELRGPRVKQCCCVGLFLLPLLYDSHFVELKVIFSRLRAYSY